MTIFQEAIFRVVAAILHLGNIEFAKGEEIDSSVIKDEKSRFHLNTTAELLRCAPYTPFLGISDSLLIVGSLISCIIQYIKLL